MAIQLPVYQSKQVKISFLGQDITGLAESFASISRNTDFTVEKVGADGSVSISVHPDETGTFELTLDQNSPAQIFLSGVIEAQKAAKTLYSGSFTLTDPSGSAIVKLSNAHIKSGPTMTFGSESQDWTWTIFCCDYTYLSVPEGIAEDLGVIAEVSAALDNLPQFEL
jgi:hypothetical protein